MVVVVGGLTGVPVCICRGPVQAEGSRALQICSHPMRTPMYLRRMLDVSAVGGVNGYLGYLG